MTTDADQSTAQKAAELLRLHYAPELLTVVNVWDVISARVVANVPGTKALATASHSIAAAHGYPDGEQIPRVLMIATIARIAASVKLPVTADLEAGYGDAAETISRAIDVGIVGANLEDQLKPLAESVQAVEAGPYSQNVALTALAELVESVHTGGGLPANLRILNR